VIKLLIPRTLIDVDTGQLEAYHTDVIVVGSGIAGLYTAIQASQQHQVLLISKKTIHDSNTQKAQGGIAAVLAESDSPDFHRKDTLIAGAGLCSQAAVNVLVHEGPAGVEELIRLGTEFDLEDGRYALTQEGAHSQRRILHAHGDATGAEIVRALSEQVVRHPTITVWEDHFALDAITHDDECHGMVVQRPDGSLVAVFAKATVLATGGAGQLYRYTTNPEIATGDGVAVAYRAGAQIQDVEFIQFHPTALCYPGAPRFLVSEAVRGEGAVLRNILGERFMQHYHEQQELAPRDIVARAIVSEIEKTKASFVYLDITHESEGKIRHRFPTIHETCLKYGLDLTTDWIPVAPASHYIMGGVKTDLHGQTTIGRLYACGEVSCTGVHGANRLASNSLSEAIVFGRRIAESIENSSPISKYAPFEFNQGRLEPLIHPVIEKRLKLQKIMVRHVGLKRSAKGLNKALQELERLCKSYSHALSRREEYEFLNMLTCAMLTTQAALAREESRGGHYRDDFPERDDLIWKKHILFQREIGMLEEAYEDELE
jgi:L-aspartate oxidase